MHGDLDDHLRKGNWPRFVRAIEEVEECDEILSLHRHGEQVAVVVSPERWARMQKALEEATL